jgi:hypothetical protein
MNEKLCQCGHPYRMHLEPEYSQTMCTLPDCKCKKFIAVTSSPDKQAVEALVERIAKGLYEQEFSKGYFDGMSEGHKAHWVREARTLLQSEKDLCLKVKPIIDISSGKIGLTGKYEYIRVADYLESE